jgi:hypothetical protein
MVCRIECACDKVTTLSYVRPAHGLAEGSARGFESTAVNVAVSAAAAGALQRREAMSIAKRYFTSDLSSRS